MTTIGVPPSSIMTTRGYRASVMAARAAIPARAASAMFGL